MKNSLLILILFLAFAGTTQTGSIRGVIKGESTSTSVPFTMASIHKMDGSPIAFIQANIDGIYSFSNLAEGKYILKFNTTQHNETLLTGVQVLNGKMTMQTAYLDAE
jgi:hypothetical protein